MSGRPLFLNFPAALAAAFLIAAPALAQNATVTRLTSGPRPSLAGQSVTLTAEVDGFGGAAPTGQVVFSEGALQRGVGTLRAVGAGQATISADGSHSCAITSTGGLKCWGSNSFGQLGDNSIFHATPTLVPKLSSGVAAVSAGFDHTCALTAVGGVKCWGNNDQGQLGDGTANLRHEPVDVIGLTRGVIAISAGPKYSCAIDALGGVRCWGRNNQGQLGDGTTTGRSIPTPVIGLQRGVVSVALGGIHSCALTVYGGVRCWGNNALGQLGAGNLVSTLKPVFAKAVGYGVRSISAGYGYTCAVTDSGAAKCWGNNGSGQLGDGTTAYYRLTPVTVSGHSNGVVAIAAADSHACALRSVGGLKCWGSRSSGNLGDGIASGDNALLPVDVVGITSGAVAVSANQSHNCALLADTTMKCWGNNAFGQTGNGTTNFSMAPVPVSGLASGVAQIVAGGAHACARKTNSSLKCWGGNEGGQLGDGTREVRYTPVSVLNVAGGQLSIAAGLSHSCHLTIAGLVACWGSNASGQLGDGTRIGHETPLPVFGLSQGVVAISAGEAHSCAVDAAGGAKCWGGNARGQLGDGSVGVIRERPVNVAGLSTGLAAVAAGASHSCALARAGGVWCWGDNSSGQLGDGGVLPLRAWPAPVPGLDSGVVQLTAGARHNCALTRQGAVKCWGGNESGQLGGSGSDPLVTPSGLASGVVGIASGGGHNCAVTSAGEVKCWGANYDGQLGDGTFTSSPVPKTVAGLKDVASLSLGYAFSCALTRGGSAKCWGANHQGQLGNGVTWIKATPVATLNFTGLTRARAEVATSFKYAGGHTLRANYNGDAAHSGSMGVAVHWVMQ